MKPRHRYPGSPDIATVDYITLSISTYPADLKIVDGIVSARKASGDRKASRSSVYREAVRSLAAHGKDH